MTNVAFHFNIPDKLEYACRLLRKARASGHCVGVVSDAELVEQLDARLWAFSALDFIAHCRVDAPDEVLTKSPVVLSTYCTTLPSSEVLVHLGHEVPQGFEKFRRLIELVGTEAQDRMHGRKRWKYYESRGYAITTYDYAAHVSKGRKHNVT